MATILVTGATGAVGPRVVETLSGRGDRIRTLSLQPFSEGTLRGGVEERIGDVTDPDTVRSAVQGVEVLIHLAALLHIVDPPPVMRERYERVNVGGTATVVRAAVQARVRRLVLFSTISVYGPSRGRMLTEETPAAPDGYYAETKLAAERVVLTAAGPDGTPLGVVLRLASVYGPRIKGNYRQLLRLLSRGLFVPVGSGRNRRTLVYDRDVAWAAAIAADHPAAAGRIYNVTDGQVHTMAEIIQAMSGALGRNPPRFRLPLGPIRSAAGVLDGAAKLLGRRSPGGRAAIEKYTEEVAVAGRRIQAELGFKPQYDLAAGWEETVREMRKAGEL